MNKLILIGRSGAGKTTLTQALTDAHLQYLKTQDVKHTELMIDTPGEYIQERHLGGAVAVFVYESDIVGLLMSADEPYSLFSPNIVNMCNRYVIGIITGIDKPNANLPRVTNWLKQTGVKKIFYLSSVTGEGVTELREFLETFDPRAERKKEAAYIQRLKYPHLYDRSV
ncbi:MAG: ethanolamine utilization protein EutP [Clostridia bacterium]|nr:ethanolamine utilization protein EutP [Clostridia bacterium]